MEFFNLSGTSASGSSPWALGVSELRQSSPDDLLGEFKQY